MKARDVMLGVCVRSKQWERWRREFSIHRKVKWAGVAFPARLRRALPAICGLLLLTAFSGSLRAEDIDFSVYRRAADQCRGDVSRPMTLLSNKHILCLNDNVSASEDLSLAKQLEPSGLFVVSAYGGDDMRTMALAELLAERNATVVIYDHCFSACASYLLIASSKVIVLKDALVAWDVLGAERGDCLQFVQALDKGPERYDVGKCPQPLSRIDEAGEIYQAKQRFFEQRRIDPLLEEPPESAFVRKSISDLFARLKYTVMVMWTWNPSYYAGSIKTNIVYEAYPKSQREVDAIAKRLRLFYRVIYDP